MIVFHLLNVNNGNMVKAASLLHFLLLNPSLKPFQVQKVNERIDFIKFIKELEPKKH